jgi:hypothetical protein
LSSVVAIETNSRRRPLRLPIAGDALEGINDLVERSARVDLRRRPGAQERLDGREVVEDQIPLGTTVMP